jgi:hypothetical protein
MEIKIGDRVLWGEETLREGTVTKRRIDGGCPYIWVDSQHAPEDCISTAYVWPVSAKSKLIAVRAKRAELKAAYDDSAKLIYELRNKIAKGEYKWRHE